MNATGGCAQLPRSWRRNVARCTVHVLLYEKVNSIIALSSFKLNYFSILACQLLQIYITEVREEGFLVT